MAGGKNWRKSRKLKLPSTTQLTMRLSLLINGMMVILLSIEIVTSQITPTVTCYLCNGDDTAIFLSPYKTINLTSLGLVGITSMPCESFYQFAVDGLLTASECYKAQKLTSKLCECSNTIGDNTLAIEKMDDKAARTAGANQNNLLEMAGVRVGPSVSVPVVDEPTTSPTESLEDTSISPTKSIGITNEPTLTFAPTETAMPTATPQPTTTNGPSFKPTPRPVANPAVKPTPKPVANPVVGKVPTSSPTKEGMGMGMGKGKGMGMGKSKKGGGMGKGMQPKLPSKKGGSLAETGKKKIPKGKTAPKGSTSSTGIFGWLLNRFRANNQLKADPKNKVKKITRIEDNIRPTKLSTALSKVATRWTEGGTVNKLVKARGTLNTQPETRSSNYHESSVNTLPTAQPSENLSVIKAALIVQRQKNQTPQSGTE